MTCVISRIAFKLEQPQNARKWTKTFESLNVTGFNTILVLLTFFIFKHLCYMLGTRTVRQPNESAAAELRADYCSAVLKIRLVSAQKPFIPFINMDNHALFCM